MTSITAQEAAKQPIVTDSEVEVRVDELVGRACRRQFWMLFVDENHVQLPIIMPMEDYPSSPDEGNAELLASAIADVVDTSDIAQVIFVWERRLQAASTPADCAWAKALGSACAAKGVAVRAQLISHRSGVRWFPLDEYV